LVQIDQQNTGIDRGNHENVVGHSALGFGFRLGLGL
jgi:hypothetical protein